MSMSAFFEELGAPLKNKMWSWGAVRESDKTVFLRVWQNDCDRIDDLGKRWFTWVIDSTNNSLGGNERRMHVDLIKSGYKAYMIMCQGPEGKDYGDKIADFDRRDLRPGGELIEHDGSIKLETLPRIPVADVKPRKSENIS